MELGSHKKKLEGFISFCEDTIFEMDYSDKISGSEQQSRESRANQHRLRHTKALQTPPRSVCLMYFTTTCMYVCVCVCVCILRIIMWKHFLKYCNTIREHSASAILKLECAICFCFTQYHTYMKEHNDLLQYSCVCMYVCTIHGSILTSGGTNLYTSKYVCIIYTCTFYAYIMI